MKPGYRTTEFWTVLAADIGAVLTDAANGLPDKYAAIVISVATGAYAISRGIAKAFPPKPGA